MKFKYINFNKIICILASSIIVLNISGCENNIQKKVEENNYIEEINNNLNYSENTKLEDTLEDTKNNDIEYTNVDMKIINEFNKLEQKLDEIIKSEKVAELKENAKEIFILSVDFIFYEGEIKGTTFNELSNQGKEKVLSIVSSIDSKIENKFPDYKENVSSTTNDILKKASELVNKGKNNINNFSKDILGDKYDDFIETKNEVISSTKDSINDIIDYSEDAYKKGKEYLKEWYKNLKK